MTHRLTTLLALVSLPSVAAAQGYWDRTQIEFDLPFGVTRIHTGEFSGDGWPDLISNDMAWYRNPGAQPFGGWIGYLVQHLGSQDELSVGDVDGDGDDDVFVVQNSVDIVRWWEQTAPGAFTPHDVTTGSSLQFNAALASGDLDGDGTLDVVVETAGPAITAFLNVAGDGSVWQPLWIADTATVIDLDIGDVDGDGDADVFASTGFAGSPGLAWYENAVGPGGWTEHLIDPSLAGAFPAGMLADLDGDGDGDVLSIYEDSMRIHTNQGGGTSWTVEFVGLPEHFTSLRCDTLADIDSDGDPDLVGVAYLGPAMFWLENGNGWAVHEFADPEPISLPGDVSPLDADLDCDLDIGARVDDPIGTIDGLFWYENPLDPSRQAVRLGTPPNTLALLPAAESPHVGDIWRPTFDFAAFPEALATVLILSLEPAELPLPNGSLLIDLDTRVVELPVASGVQPEIEVPNKCSFLGLALHAQAAFVDLTDIWPTNAIDIVIGPR